MHKQLLILSVLIHLTLCCSQVFAQQGEDLVPPPPPPATIYNPPVYTPPVTEPGTQQNSMSSIAGASGSPISGDFTTNLSLKKGMKIIFDIRSGLDTRWKHVGDYTFEAKIDFNDARGYAFDWHMSPPANASGSRAVDAEDMKSAHKVSLFYPDNESATLIGYTSIVRISDYLYKKLKAGEKANFSLDGPESPLVMKRHSRPIANSIFPVGNENLTIKIDGVDRDVRTIKASTDVGWSYWILDNPEFPIMLQGDGPFQWKSALLSYGGSGTNNGSNTTDGSKSKKISGVDQNKKLKAKNEAEKVIDQLKKSGKAVSHLILFDFDSDRLRPISKEILIELSAFLKKSKELKLRVEGHTCNIGGKQYNLNLSQRRAESVKRYLVDHCSIAPERLIPLGYGYSKPVKPNDTEKNREQNRRVVFTEIE